MTIASFLAVAVVVWTAYVVFLVWQERSISQPLGVLAIGFGIYFVVAAKMNGIHPYSNLSGWLTLLNTLFVLPVSWALYHQQTMRLWQITACILALFVFNRLLIIADNVVTTWTGFQMLKNAIENGQPLPDVPEDMNPFFWSEDQEF